MIKEKMKLFVRADNESSTGMRFLAVNALHEYWMGDADIKLGEIEVSYSPPEGLDESELRRKAISTLQDKQKRVRAEAEVSCLQLQSQIEKLMLLSYQPTSEVISDGTSN